MHSKQAGDYIPRAYQALLSEGLDPFSARDRIEKDLVDIFSRRTIQRHIPEEAKHLEKTKKQLITVTAGNRQELEPPLRPDNLKTTVPAHLPITNKKEETFKKFKLECDLEFRDQTIPCIHTIYIDWDAKTVESDRLQVNRED